jgi:acetyltransferase-like isoleucine patch superfamily enzyme
MSILFSLVIRWLRGSWLRLFLAEAGGSILVGKGVKMSHAQHIKAKGNLIVEDYAEVQGMSLHGLQFGHRVSVGKFASIRPGDYYGKHLGEGLAIGDNSNIGAYSYVGCSGFISIGRNVMISPRVSLYAENHVFEDTDRPMKEQGVRRGKIVIEDDCWIAANAIILSNVTVGRGSIVAAGSVVTKDVPPYSIVAGSPAQVIKSRLG